MIVEMVLAAGIALQKAPAAAPQKEQAPAPAASCIAVPEAGHAGARALGWYIDGETVTVGGAAYTKYGLPRVLGPSEVVYSGAYRGGFFYAEPGIEKGAEVVYLLTDAAGCEFQPYQVEPSG